MLSELRASIRGRSLAELTVSLEQDARVVERSCAVLEAKGQAVKRGQKWFVA